MSRIRRFLIPLIAAATALLSAPLVGAAPAAADVRAAATTVCYNVTYAGQFADEMHTAASIWNSRVSNVRLSNCGSDMMVYEISGGGSYAIVYGLGRGAIYIDRQQAQQYSPLRIVSHETGHILGLPDNYNGNCAILMSGGSAGTSCTNPYPSAGEAAQVDYLFGFAPSQRTADGFRIYLDSWPAHAA